MHWMVWAILAGGFVSSATITAAAGEGETFWGQWRGPHRSGVAPKATPPTEWSATKNLRWKRELPGEGASTPIVWGDLVFIQAAIPKNGSLADQAQERRDPSNAGSYGTGGPGRPDRRGGGGRQTAKAAHQFTVLAFEAKTGNPVWERVVCEQAPHEGNHRDGTLASASPVTDGDHLFAYFGSRGLYCLTLKGDVVWKQDFGDMKTRNAFGEGSSPTLHGDTLVVNWDHEAGSFIVALDKASGKEKWRQDRDEVTSWSTPLVIEDNGRPQVVVSATNRVRSYELASGKVLWECGGLGANCVASPVVGGGLVFAMSGHRDPALLALRYPGAKGDLSHSDSIAWRLDSGTPYVPSPLLYGDMLYFAQKNDGIISCYDAKTGKPHYTQQRLEEAKGIYSSPVGADGRVYVLGRNGATYVLKHGPRYEVLAINKLEDRFSASPALVGENIYLRGHKYLYCIGGE